VREINFPELRQTTCSSCGAATLATAYCHLGFEGYHEERLINDLNLTDEGLDWPDIEGHAKSLGIQTKLITDSSYEDLKKYFELMVQINGCVIVAWFSDLGEHEPWDHFSVLRAIDDHQIVLHDSDFPFGTARVELSKADFELRWGELSADPKKSFLILSNPSREKTPAFVEK
jgi:predicted double-glycine peptidase